MRLYYGLLAAVFILGLALAGCLHPVTVNVEKRCTTGMLGGVSCECRDKVSGRFVVCPPEWRER